MTNINLFAMIASRSALVVKSIHIDENGSLKGKTGLPTYVEIIGRKAGLISWIRSLMGFDTTARFTVHEKRATYSEKALSGHLSHIFPFTSVANLGTGYLKPFYWLLLAIPIIFGGISYTIKGVAEVNRNNSRIRVENAQINLQNAQNRLKSETGYLARNEQGNVVFTHDTLPVQKENSEKSVSFIIFVGIMAIVIPVIILYVLYHLGKTMCLYFVSNSGDTVKIFVKRSVIENVEVSKQDAERIINIVLQLVEINHARKP